jgi:uncharacterized SAM-binding protein YcdF (DUF218 family)
MWSGLIAGALLGILTNELGFWAIIGWDFDMYDMLIFAAVAAVGSVFPVLLRVVSVASLALLALVCLIALTPVMSTFTSRWVRADALSNQPFDAAVVLSSGVTSNGTLTTTGADRLLAGLELVQRGAAARLITTRVAYRGSRRSVTSDGDQRRLITLAGVADRWVLLEDAVHQTHDESLAVSRRLRAMGLGLPSVAVVTSPLHTRRACATFERQGMRVTCVPSLERDDQTRSPRNGPDRLGAFRSYVYERVGWWVYRRRGWV